MPEWCTDISVLVCWMAIVAFRMAAVGLALCVHAHVVCVCVCVRVCGVCVWCVCVVCVCGVCVWCV